MSAVGKKLMCFDLTTTNMPHYDNMLGADAELTEYLRTNKDLDWCVEFMSPDDYVQRVVDGRDGAYTATELRASRRDERISGFANKMLSGSLFPVLVLDYSNRGRRLSQEGLHRAFAAMQAGIMSLPVLVVKSTLPDDHRWHKGW